MIQKTHERIQNTQHSLEIVLMAENIRTPENVGMMMRLSEAFGVQKIYFVGTLSLELSTKVKRASRNTFKTMKYEFGVEGTEKLEQLIDSDYHAIALEITDRSTPISTITTSAGQKIVVIVGSERQGVSEELLQQCENHYHIPMFGDNSSINVVNALAIGLYKLTE